MRRLLAVNLIVALLGQLSVATAPVVPCPMHGAGAAGGHRHANSMAASHHELAGHQSPSNHGTTAQGCTCTGECGRSGAGFSLPATALFAVVFEAGRDVIVTREQPELASVGRLLPFATGPPQRLRI